MQMFKQEGLLLIMSQISFFFSYFRHVLKAEPKMAQVFNKIDLFHLERPNFVCYLV